MKVLLFFAGFLTALGTAGGYFLPHLSLKSRPKAEPMVIVLQGRREPGEAMVSKRAMKYLPFEVPSGVTRMVIHKEFEHGSNPELRNTVDMGLFDPRGGDATVNHPSTRGFRGWQGGVPNDLIVAETPDACSPHAIPGNLPAGRWYIAQYFLKSTPAGLGYKYTITLYPDGPGDLKGNAPIPDYKPGVIRKAPGWYVGNLHSHTVHSDGGNSLNDLVTLSERQKFDFIAVTDHNSPATHYRFAEVGKAHPNHLLLMGEEFTSPGGHANIIGQKPGHFFDFRFDPGDNRLPGIIDEAHRQHALFMVNHPFAPCTSCTWLYPAAEWAKADAIEVWNGVWTPDDRRAVDLWDRELKRGRRIHAFGGTDYHRGNDAMTPAVRVYADNLSRQAILKGLGKGHVTLAESPDGPMLTLTDTKGHARPGETLSVKRGEQSQVTLKVTGGSGKNVRIITHEGEHTEIVHSDNARILYAVPALPEGRDAGYIRAELTDASGKMIALTNPLYIAIER